MPENLPSLQFNQRPEASATEAAYAGAVLLGEASKQRATMQLDGQLFSTDLPEGVNPFYVEEKNPRPMLGPVGRDLNPDRFDDIPVGDFVVQGDATFKDEWGMGTVTHPVRRSLSIIETPDGKAITAASLNSDRIPTISKQGNPVLAALGYVIGPDTHTRDMVIKAVPTPETFKRAAERIGVDVELIRGTAHIDTKRYLGLYVAGKYGVATGHPYYYKHDTEHDHVPAMVFGGEPLKSALAESAAEGLAYASPKDRDNRAEAIDKFTSTLTAVVSPAPNLAGEAFGERLGRTTYMRAATTANIPAETANIILATAQTNARRLGMSVQNLL